MGRRVYIGGGTGNIDTSVSADGVTYSPAIPGDWPVPPPNNVAAALNELVARADATEPYAFVLRPGDPTPGANVFADWPSLYTVMSAVQGAKLVVVDDSLISPVVIPAGTWDVSEVEFQGVANATTLSGGAALSLADGCHFTCETLRFRGAINVTSAAATDIITVPVVCNVWFDEDSYVKMTGAGAFMHVTGTGIGFIEGRGINFGDGTHAVLTVDATALGYLQVFDASVIHAASVSAAAYNTLIVYYDGSTIFTGAASPNVIYVLQENAPGTPAYNPFWYALTDIYWDPANSSGVASDFNSGATALLPVLTFAELVRRWGSRSPTFKGGQQTTLHIMSGQSVAQASSDPIGSFKPNAPYGAFVTKGVLAAFGAAFAIGVVTQPVQTAAGTDFQVAGMPVGAAAGMILVDPVAGSSCVIISVLGGVARCTMPHALIATPIANPTITQDPGAWTNGDVGCQLYTAPVIYADEWSPSAGSVDVAASDNSGFTWLQDVTFGGTSTGTGQGRVTIAPIGGMILYRVGAVCTTNVESNCLYASRGTVTVTPGADEAVSCYFPDGGAFNGNIAFNGCYFSNNNGGFTPTFRDKTILTHGSIVDGTACTIAGVNVVVSGVHFVPLVFIEPFCALVMSAPGGGNVAMWGAASVSNLGAVVNRTGDTYVNQLKMGGALTLTNAALTTGTITNLALGVVSFAQSAVITAAVIDAGGTYGPGVFDPPSGARYS